MSTPPPPAPSANITSTTLCTHCHTFLATHLLPKSLYPLSTSTSTSTPLTWTHTKPALLACATAAHCRFCSLVLANVRQWEGYEAAAGFVGIRSNEFGGRVWEANPNRRWRDLYVVVEGDGGREGEVLYLSFERGGEPESWNPIPITSTNTGSDESLAKMSSWLSRCRDHPTCNRWSSLIGSEAGLPTRLLRLEAGKDFPKVRLVETSSMVPASDYRYVTLSHCWGRDHGVRLLASNLQASQSDIPWKSLHRTFREAVLLTLRLGIEYLWIDALCIIQDSGSDWHSEAARMAQVYANCYLNISADASTDGHGGLFRDRCPEAAQSFYITMPGLSKDDGSAESFLCFAPRWRDQVEEAPTKERAWIVQERFLSPRVVHFSEGQLHWECADLMTSESVPDGHYIVPRTKRTYRKSPACCEPAKGKWVDMKGRYRLWTRLVGSYSCSLLSVEADRPIAIAGLARAMASLVKVEASDYLAGLWRPMFVAELMWFAEGGRRREGDKMPTWSWLSLDSAIANLDVWKYNGGDWKPIAQVRDVNVTYIRDPFGAVSSGIARLRAPLCRLSVSLVDAFDLKPAIRLVFGNGFEPKLENWDIYLDERGDALQQLVGCDIFLMLGGASIGRPQLAFQQLDLSSKPWVANMKPGPISYGVGNPISCLLLKAAFEPGSYNRVGYVYVPDAVEALALLELFAYSSMSDHEVVLR